MKKLARLVIWVGVAISCQIEDENAPAPNESFTKYYGELTSYEAKDIEIIYDASGETPTGFVVFGTVLVEQGNRDFFIMTTDLDGNLLDTARYGFNLETQTDWTGDGNPDDFTGDESAGQIEVVPGLGYLIIGTSSIDEPDAEPVPINDYSTISFGALDLNLDIVSGVGRDSLVVRPPRDPDLALDSRGNDIILLSDNSILLVGSAEFDRGGGVTDFDNFYIKLGETDSFVESEGIAGPGQNSEVVRAFERDNGNLIMIGTTSRPSRLGENNGDNGTNVYYLEVDPNGTAPINSGSYGIDDNNPETSIRYDDVVSSAVFSESGFVVAGTSRTSGSEDYGFVMHLTPNGVHQTSSTLPSSFGGIQTRVNGLTMADDKDVVLVGQYPNFIATVNGQNLSKSAEGLFMKVDQSSQPIEGFETNFGLTDGNDQIVDAVTLPDGKIVAVANVDFGGGVQLISIIKLNDSGSFEN